MMVGYFCLSTVMDCGCHSAIGENLAGEKILIFEKAELKRMEIEKNLSEVFSYSYVVVSTLIYNCSWR